MDKKKLIQSLIPEDLRGFEDFLEGHPKDSNFLPRGVGGGVRRENNFEHFTFLNYDSARLNKIRSLLCEKLPFSSNYPQSDKILNNLNQNISKLRNEIYQESCSPDSGYQKSLRELFDGFFGQIKN